MLLLIEENNDLELGSPKVIITFPDNVSARQITIEVKQKKNVFEQNFILISAPVRNFFLSTLYHQLRHKEVIFLRCNLKHKGCPNTIFACNFELSFDKLTRLTSLLVEILRHLSRYVNTLVIGLYVSVNSRKKTNKNQIKIAKPLSLAKYTSSYYGGKIITKFCREVLKHPVKFTEIRGQMAYFE